MTFGEIEKEWAGLDDREREREKEKVIFLVRKREREGDCLSRDIDKT